MLMLRLCASENQPYYYYFFECTLKNNLIPQSGDVQGHQHPKWDQNASTLGNNMGVVGIQSGQVQ